MNGSKKHNDERIKKKRVQQTNKVRTRTQTVQQPYAQHTTTYTYHTITHTNCLSTYEKYNDAQRILTRTQNNQQRINNYINMRNIIHTSLNAIKKQQKRKHNNDNTIHNNKHQYA